MSSILLGFSYVVEESGAHLFGVPHRHKHVALVLNFKLLIMRSKPLLNSTSDT